MAVRSQPSRSLLRRTLGQSALVGVAAYVLGYLLTLVFMLVDGVEFGGEAGRLKVAGWVFFATHLVDLRLTGAAGGRSASGTVDVFGGLGQLANLTSTVPELLYLLVPIVVLVGTSLFLVRRVADGRTTVGTAAGVGASVAAGYLPMAVVGQFLFSHTETGFGGAASVTVAPDLLSSVLLAGIVYPLVCGVVGGVLGQQMRGDRSSEYRM